MSTENKRKSAGRYGMTIDIDRCNGCGSCMVACAVENNVPPAAAGASDRTGITWLRVFPVDNGAQGKEKRIGFYPHDVPALQATRHAWACVRSRRSISIP